MLSAFARNAYVSLAAFAATAGLVSLEVLTLPSPPSGAWFAAVLAVTLLGFAWVNAAAFPSLKHPLRALAVGALVVAMWASTSFVAVVLGVNLKFALGGHL